MCDDKDYTETHQNCVPIQRPVRCVQRRAIKLNLSESATADVSLFKERHQSPSGMFSAPFIAIVDLRSSQSFLAPELTQSHIRSALMQREQSPFADDLLGDLAMPNHRGNKKPMNQEHSTQRYLHPTHSKHFLRCMSSSLTHKTVCQ